VDISRTLTYNVASCKKDANALFSKVLPLLLNLLTENCVVLNEMQ
jgi:hypothetical protein